MSETSNHNNDAPATSSTTEPAATPSSSSSAAGAVDTGRRIDPALLSRGTVRRGRPAPPESAIVAPEGVEPAIRVVERPQATRPRGPVVDAATIAERARSSGGPARHARGARPMNNVGDAVEGTVGDAAPGEAAAGDASADAASAERSPRGAVGGERGRGPRRDRGARGDRAGRGNKGDRGPRGGRDVAGEAAPSRGPRLDYADLAPIVVARDEDVGDFAAMLAESGAVDRRDVRIGDKVRAECVHIGSDAVFFQLSATQQAHAPRAEFVDEKTGDMTIHVGQFIDVFVVAFKDGIVLSPKIGRDMIDVGMLENARANSIPVDGTITGVNKGGFEVQLSGSSRGFCPTGQIDINFVNDPQTFIGKTLQFLVREVKEGGKNVVLSRRSLLEKERAEKAARLRERLGIGLVLEGTITRLQPFGAFVDLGGLDGLVPVSEMAYGRVADPSEVVKVGDVVKVEVIKIDQDPKRPGQERIGLSMKTQQQDPLVQNMNLLSPGAQMVGRVSRLESYGAFVELFPGVEGLVHVSEVTDRRIRHPEDVLKVDEHVQVRVKDVDLARRRVSLSMRDASGESAEVPVEAAEKPKKKGLARGTRVTGVVDRIERYGVFVNLFADGTDPSSSEQLGTALMPAVETGTPRGADLGRAFPLGTQVPVLVVDVDERGRLKVSKTAREQAEERALVEQFKGEKGSGGKAGLGTLGDLLKARLGQ
jgi:small subunit ribosomal protein S1